MQREKVYREASEPTGGLHLTSVRIGARTALQTDSLLQAHGAAQDSGDREGAQEPQIVSQIFWPD